MPEPRRARRPEPVELAEHAWREYLGACDAYWDMLALAKSVKKRDSPTRFRDAIKRELRDLPRSERLLVGRALVGMMERQPPPPSADEDSSAAAEAAAEDEAAASEQSGPLGLSNNALGPLNNLMRYFSMSAHAPPRLPLFYKSLLTTHVAALEVLLGHLVHAFYQAHPGALGSSRQIALGELHTFTSVEELLLAAIDDEVDAFQRRPYEDREQWFKEHYKISLAKSSRDEAALSEVFLRRHVIVHNDGRVSRQYRAAVGKSAPVLGTTLPVDEGYIRRAFDDLLVFGSVVGMIAWRRLKPADPAFSESTFIFAVYHQMVAGRWHAVQGMCERGRELIATAEEHRFILQFNGWLARKRLFGLSEIEAEVQSFDISALHPRFRVAWHALLDHNAELTDLVPKAVESGSLEMWAVHQWPLLEEYRRMPGFAEFVARREPWHEDAKSRTPSDPLSNLASD